MPVLSVSGDMISRSKSKSKSWGNKPASAKTLAKRERRRIRREVKIFEDRVFRGVKPKSEPSAKRGLTQGQVWWRSLSAEEQSERIAQWETSRKAVDYTKPLPAPEEFGDGYLKLWINHDSYKVLKPYMWIYTERSGYEEVHPDFYETRKYELASKIDAGV